MRYISAYMLAAMSGKHHVTTADIENILGSVGVDCDHKMASSVVDQMHGKTLEEVIAAGSDKLASVSSAGSVAASTSPSAVSSAATPAAPAEEKKEAKKEEKEEESDEDLGFGLFD